MHNSTYFFLLLIFSFFIGKLDAQTQQKYETPGTHTWIVPPCVTEITVKVWGGGGGGGGTSSRQTTTDEEACTQGGGGGGGGFAMRTYSVTPGETYTIVVGAGGTGGIGANNTAVSGGTGGTSSFTGPATTPFGALTGFGGAGGTGATAYNNNTGNHHIGSNGVGGIGGNGANGTAMFSGGKGSDGSHSGGCVDISGAGGGGAGSTGNGANGQQIGGCPHTAAMQGGAGANDGGGKGANGVKNNIQSMHKLNGNAGSPYGGGGSGAGIHLNSWANQWVLANGGAGANGAVIIEYTVSGSLPDKPSVIAGNNVLPCGGGTETYSVTNEAGITYTWTYSGTGTITGTGNTASLTATTGGTITVTPTGMCGDGPSETLNVTIETPPNNPISISGTSPIPCGSSTNTYTATAVAGVTYTWSYSGTGTITSGQGTNTITLDATSGGTLAVAISNVCGNGTQTTYTVAQQASPNNPSVISGNNNLPCNGGSGTYSVTNVSGITYTWSYSGTGTITSGQGTNSITLDATSGGTLTVTPSNACGNGTPQTISISLGTTPINLQPIQGNTLIPCGGASGTYSVINETGITYTWSYSGQGTITSGQGTSTITLDATTGGVLTVATANDCGNGPSETLTIMLDVANQTVDFNLPNNLCINGNTVTLAGTPAGGQFTMNGNTISEINPTALAVGSYTVKYTVNDNGCLLTADKTVQINGLPQLSSDLAPEYCHGTPSVAIHFQPNGGTATGDYLTGTTLNLTNATSGAHTVTYSYTDANGCSATMTQNYTVGTELNTTISYEESCMNVVTFAVSDENYQYNWNFYAFGTSTEKKPQVQFGSVGTHPIAVTITDSKNCSKVIQQDVIVSGTTVNTTLNIPNVITVNNDGVNDFFELDASLFDCLDLTITIVNRWGNPIFELDKDNLKFEGKTTKGKEITEGVYFYSVDSEKLGCKNGVGTNNCNGFITIIK